MIDDPTTGGRMHDHPPLEIRRCGDDHTFLYPHPRCPICGKTVRESVDPPTATLISHTTVRVTPAGRPFRLGLARTRSGAQTLCIVDDGVEGDGEVMLYFEDGLYHAAAGRSNRRE